MRPTWHFVLPADIRWLLELTAPRVNAVSASYYRRFELDDATFARGNDLLARALQGGNQLTRPELARVLGDGGIDASSLRLGYLLMRAEIDAVICSGALRGKQFTYALLDERAPSTRSLARDEALAELTRRYFTSHGPATVQDYAWWSGLTVADARAGIAMVRTDLTQETMDGKTYWFAGATAVSEETYPIVHLLPNYDEHLIAYKDHGPSFDAEVLKTLDPQADVLMAHIIVMNGHVIGGWRRTLKKNEAIITTKLLVPLSRSERAALEAAAVRYGQFMGMPVTLL
jgi:hypothetical protein